MYRINLHGLAIECDTFEEVRKVVDTYLGRPEGVAPQPSLPPPTPLAQTLGGPKRGAGPRKSWLFARWLAEKEKIKPDAARTRIAEMRRTDYAQHQALEAEFFADLEAKHEV